MEVIFNLNRSLTSIVANSRRRSLAPAVER
jgi:hypothetical protein